MGTLILETSARAFGVFVFLVVYLSFEHRAFPRSWGALAAAFLFALPFAFLYGWLSGDFRGDSDTRRWRVPKLLLVGVGAAIVIAGKLLYATEVNGFFYPQ
jgi:hypothetical protein